MTIVETPNLVDQVWESWEESKRPARPQEPVFLLEEKYHGKLSTVKFAEIAEAVKEKKVKHLLVTTLDDICWMLNMRGSDIACNPVFFANLIFDVE
jgi:Xaa-Pro aminopeptidase